MAYRDKTQGFAFVYVDVKKLLEENRMKGGVGDAVEQDPSASKAMGTVVNFNKDSHSPNAVKAEIAKRMGSWDAKEFSDPSKHSPAEKHEAVQKLKHNLDRLTSLHHQLHVALADMKNKTKKDKK